MGLNRIVIQWPRFGPYHLARLRATHALLESHGVELIGLETASQDSLYDWRTENAAEPFRREQALPGKVFEDVRPVRMRAATWAALERLDPNAVGIMSYGYPDARTALEWCRHRRRIAILMTDSRADDAPRVAWREAFKRLVVGQYDAALVAGSEHREYLVGLGFPPQRIFLGYDVVDNAYFEAGAAKARAQPERWRHFAGLEGAGQGTFTPYFLASNRFIPRKNLKRLILAYAGYREKATTEGVLPWRLLLLGDGPGRPALESLVQEQCIDEVTFCGFRQINELPIYYGLASAFVHPALSDQWGLVINEAMASGLPIAASTGAGATRDLVQHGHNGYHFDPRNVDDISHCLFQLASVNRDLEAMRSNSSKRIAEWDLDRFTQSFWESVQVGRQFADRRPNPAAQLLLRGLNTLTRDVRALHTFEV